MSITVFHVTERSGNKFHTTVKLIALFLIGALAPGAHSAEFADLQPSTEFSPQQVIEIVIEALGGNGETEGDVGIETVYRFASPGNRANTGPLSRFTMMIKTGFADMLDHKGPRFEPMEIRNDKAVQAIWLLTAEGYEVGYAFQMGLQGSGIYEGMWMTEAVVPLGKKKAGTRI
ncbi:MAG: DUF4864 domain-containing protein [Granulosicoccus sp.]